MLRRLRYVKIIYGGCEGERGFFSTSALAFTQRGYGLDYRRDETRLETKDVESVRAKPVLIEDYEELARADPADHTWTPGAPHHLPRPTTPWNPATPSWAAPSPGSHPRVNGGAFLTFSRFQIAWGSQSRTSGRPRSFEEHGARGLVPSARTLLDVIRGCGRGASSICLLLPRAIRAARRPQRLSPHADFP